MAERFKAAGYKTAMSGKWHLGIAPFRPHRQGFERTFYINKSNNQTDELWRGDKLLEKPYENRLLTEKFTRESIEFIRAKKDQPSSFTPLLGAALPGGAASDWESKSDFGVYGDVVEEMDARIGEILDTLMAEAGENAVIFCSTRAGTVDQGVVGQAVPRQKMEFTRGRPRVPCVLSWGVLRPAVR